MTSWTVRFVANAKKVGQQRDEQLTDETIELEMDISPRSLRHRHRPSSTEAFNNGRSKEQRQPDAFENGLNNKEPSQPVVVELAPKPEPKPNYAPLFTLERASTLLRGWSTTNIGSGKAVTFGPLKKAVEVLLRCADQHEWRLGWLPSRST